jgi:hypothetical protein
MFSPGVNHRTRPSGDLRIGMYWGILKGLAP